MNDEFASLPLRINEQIFGQRLSGRVCYEPLSDRVANFVVGDKQHGQPGAFCKAVFIVATDLPVTFVVIYPFFLGTFNAHTVDKVDEISLYSKEDLNNEKTRTALSFIDDENYEISYFTSS